MLTLLYELSYKSKDSKRLGMYQCDCGNTTVARINDVERGKHNHCSCRRYNKKHCLSTHPLYSVWANIKNRCYNEKSKAYRYYGARGITMCDRWKNSFENFLEDMGERPGPEYSVDRIDNDGNYEPGNCRWATAKDREQAKNTPPKKKAGRILKGCCWILEDTYNGLYCNEDVCEEFPTLCKKHYIKAVELGVTTHFVDAWGTKTIVN